MLKLLGIMAHRIFIAINLPEDVKKKLASYQANWPELPARWVKRENFHLTLVFLGYINDQELVEVCKIVRDIAKKHKPFSVYLTKLCYGPPKKIPPKLIWAEGEKIKELADLKVDLEKSLASCGIGFEIENREFRPHITLARIRKWEWRQIEPEERPEVAEDIDLSFDVNSIEVMESQLKRGGAEYTILESIPLSKY